MKFKQGFITAEHKSDVYFFNHINNGGFGSIGWYELKGDIIIDASLINGDSYKRISLDTFNFNGNRHTIKICYSKPNDTNPFYGIFEATNGSVIKNLKIKADSKVQLQGGWITKTLIDSNVENCHICGIMNGKGTGAVVGSECFGISNIINCASEGDILLGSGGIVGANAGNSNGLCSVINCTSNGDIYDKSGGIAGPDAGANGICILVNCSSNGKIINGAGIAGQYAGGLDPDQNSSPPSSYCKIYNCTSSGDIVGDLSGGIVGLGAGFNGDCTIVDCTSYGDVCGHYSGGIASGTETLQSPTTLTISYCIASNSNHLAGGSGRIAGSNIDSIIIDNSYYWCDNPLNIADTSVITETNNHPTRSISKTKLFVNKDNISHGRYDGFQVIAVKGNNNYGLRIARLDFDRDNVHPLDVCNNEDSPLYRELAYESKCHPLCEKIVMEFASSCSLAYQTIRLYIPNSSYDVKYTLYVQHPYYRCLIELGNLVSITDDSVNNINYVTTWEFTFSCLHKPKKGCDYKFYVIESGYCIFQCCDEKPLCQPTTTIPVDSTTTILVDPTTTIFIDDNTTISMLNRFSYLNTNTMNANTSINDLSWYIAKCMKGDIYIYPIVDSTSLAYITNELSLCLTNNSTYVDTSNFGALINEGQNTTNICENEGDVIGWYYCIYEEGQPILHPIINGVDCDATQIVIDLTFVSNV